jgi:hypothetical protein
MRQQARDEPRGHTKPEKEVPGLAPPQEPVAKSSRNPPADMLAVPSNPFTGNGPLNIESMNKMSQEQLRRLIPKGYDLGSFKDQLLLPP